MAVTGKVKWFDEKKGYGFITPDDPNSKEAFVHHTGIVANGFRSLAEGQRVSYDAEIDKKGLKAVNVRAI